VIYVVPEIVPERLRRENTSYLALNSASSLADYDGLVESENLSKYFEAGDSRGLAGPGGRGQSKASHGRTIVITQTTESTYSFPQ
jgi:hypothetical protein